MLQHQQPRRPLPYLGLVTVLCLAALFPFWMVQNFDALSNPAGTTGGADAGNLRPPPSPKLPPRERGKRSSSSSDRTNKKQKNSAELQVSHDSGIVDANLQEQPQIDVAENEDNEETLDNNNNKKPPKVHIVFSTSCTDQQHWESYVFFYHCFRVQQPRYGTVTRMVSGCTQPQTTALTEFHQRYIVPMSDQFMVHFTPDYSRVALEEGKRPYKYNNKPFGLLHYLQHHNNTFFGTNEDEDVIALLDPDMVLLQPILYDYTQAKNMMWVGNGGQPAWSKVTTGHPIAQQDGYLNNEWTRFDRATIFANFTTTQHNVLLSNVDGIAVPSSSDAVQHYNAGPPYLATIADWRRLANSWTKLAPPVLAVFPKLFAEMYSFVWATVYEKSPWQMTASLTISTTESADREGWKWIDHLPTSDVCAIAKAAVTNNNGTDHVLPVSLHYCKAYSLDRFLLSKYRIKKNIMNCNKNLLKVPDHLQDVLLSTPPAGDYFTADWPPQSNGQPSQSTPRRLSRRTAQRELFMLCALTTAINNALTHYKTMACRPGDGTTTENVANFNATYEIFTDYSDY
jgi:peptidyl serine alpha-galactosyltransferase